MAVVALHPWPALLISVAVPMAYATVTAAPSNKKHPTASSLYVNVPHSDTFRIIQIYGIRICRYGKSSAYVYRRPSQLTCETELYGVPGRSIHEHKRAWIEMERMGNLTLQGKAKWPMCCIFSRPNLIRQNGRIILTSASTEFLGLSRTPWKVNVGCRFRHFYARGVCESQWTN